MDRLRAFVPERAGPRHVCKILDAQEVKPHKVRLLPRTPGPEFKAKMAQVLCVYSKVNVLKESGGHGGERKTRSRARR